MDIIDFIQIWAFIIALTKFDLSFKGYNFCLYSIFNEEFLFNLNADMDTFRISSFQSYSNLYMKIIFHEIKVH